MDDTQIIQMDATQLSKAILSSEITSLEAVAVFIKHIHEVNPIINAVVEERFIEAIEEAKEYDNLLKNGQKLGPLHGVPISIKESLHVMGLKTTGGLEHRQDLIAIEDAAVVKKLKAAGAIILGKTNTPALCFCQETDNKLYGRTNNPWDISMSAGGSSGGEGALLAVGGAAVGIGSDVGGSIRFPAHFNGVIGFKPGKDQISTDGHFPSIQHELQARMLTIGPMGKSVQDMRLLYEILSNSNVHTQKLKDFKLEILPGNSGYPLSNETVDLLNQLEYFLEKSFPTKRVVPPYFKGSALIWQEIMSINGSKLVEDEAFNNDRSGVYTSFFKEKLTQRTSVHPYLSRAIIGAKMFKPSRKRVQEIITIIEQGDEMLETYLDNRLLIFPVYHETALPHGKVFKEIFSMRKTYLQFMPYVAYANVWGLPSLTIPIGESNNGLPISIQIMSKSGNEDAIFRLAKLIEKKYRGFKIAPMPNLK
ncbi:amidase [Oceanobacillus sp. E9]|uniref:Glutamyl-tRNA(Gln) amidotransferase subunit A n=1 Tax=Oceanobacillus kimchii TaxID=746691 RepID=A0ABQ5TJI6_9BACI|nr:MULTISPECIES: amidase [Oceanobacillus]OEH54019.1 amidase [Oceanobacillus sp. E9]GLO67028.1 glutamyl-tRNA(Gln) amidotransferase subunit A [Oceanobacillus kimchii]